MVSDTDSSLKPERSPWATVWLRPQATIQQVIKHPRSGMVLLLAVIGGIYQTLFPMREYQSAAPRLVDLLLLVGIGGVLLGIGYVYINAAFMAWFGRPFGGKATMRDLRAALAWSQIPQVVALSLTVAALAVFGFDAIGALALATPARPHLLLIGGALLILNLWSFVLLVRMTGAVQGFGIVGSVINSSALLLVLLLLLVFRSLAFQPFNIPAGSMMPTLLVGDYLFANKFAYGYSRYSSPLPLKFAGRIWGAEPQRGDVLIFRLPRHPSVDYVKRVIGLPGDEIQMKNGALIINGQPVPQQRGDNPPEAAGHGRTAIRHRETLPNGVSYDILKTTRESQGDNTEIFKVPAGHYFMLGDNRDNSTDSRYPDVGFIPYGNLVGRVSVVFFSHENAGSTAIRWHRMFKVPH